MARASLSLAAYLALSGRRTGKAAKPFMPRPKGEMMWLCAADATRLRPLLGIAERLRQQRPDLTLLVTLQTQPSVGSALSVPDGTILTELPAERLSDVQAFVRHWQPGVCIWASQVLHPALVHAAADTGITLILTGVEDGPLTAPALRWLPDTVTSALNRFNALIASSPAALRRLRRLSLTRPDLLAGVPLPVSGMVLPGSRRDHEKLANHLAGRPLWMAARLQPDEADTVLRAHRQVSRLAHRLLLAIVPAEPQHAAPIAESVNAAGLRCIRAEDGDLPDDITQVIVADGPDRLGLWYRLAPVAFLGSSLVPGQGGHDPFEAAALGSAILYGPNVGLHLSAYSRLVDGGAARIVKDTESLAAAVTQLIAPDRAAAMAYAGWSIVSEGAAVTDTLVDLAQDALDRAERA